VPEAGRLATAAVFKLVADIEAEAPQTAKAVVAAAEAAAAHPAVHEVVSVADEEAGAEGDRSGVAQKVHQRRREASHKLPDGMHLLPSPPLIPLLRAC
jgi:uncharacterized membrane protein